MTVAAQRCEPPFPPPQLGCWLGSCFLPRPHRGPLWPPLWSCPLRSTCRHLGQGGATLLYPILPVCQKLLSWTSSLVAMWPDSGDWGWSGGVDPPKDQTPLHLHPDPVAMLTKREGVPVPLKSWPGQGRLHGASWSCHKAWAGAVAAVSLGATAPLEPVLPSEETEKRGGGGSRELKARQARASSDPRRWL